MGFAKHGTSSYGYLPSPTCCALGFKPFRREAQTNSDQRPIEEVHNRRTTATHKDRTFRKSPKTVQVQDNFNSKSKTTSTKFQEHITNMLCYDPQLQGYFIWHCHLSHDPLAATSLDHRCTLVQVTYKCNKLQEHPKNRAVKNCQQVELQNHDNCENCCIHRPMSPHVSNCMQVTSNYLQMKTVDIKSKNSEMNIT